MQSRKKANMEIERNKRNSRRMHNAILLLVVLIVLGGIAWVATDVVLRRNVLVFEGRRVPTTDVRYYAAVVNLNPSNRDHHDMIVDTMLQHAVIYHQANLAGITLSDEEMEDWVHYVNWMRATEWFHLPPPDQITSERLAELIAISDDLFPRLLEHHVPDYDLDISHLQDELELYILNNRFDYELNATEAMFIINPDPEVLQGIVELGEVADMINFEAFAQANCTWWMAMGMEEVENYPIMDIINGLQLFEFQGELLSLQTGDISRVIPMDDDFIIIYMQDRPEVTDAEIEESFTETHTLIRRGEVFSEIVAGWLEEADYTVNRRALNGL